MYDAGKLAAKSNGETLDEHVDKALQCMNQIRSMYPEALTSHEWALLERVILFHDIGKIDPNFQACLGKKHKHDKMKFYHNMLSGALINQEHTCDLEEEDQIILYAAIYFHHNHVFHKFYGNAEKELLKYPEELKAYIKECVCRCTACYDKEIYWKGQSLDLGGNTKSLKKARGALNGKLKRWNSYIRIKGLLHRCDYAGSAGINAESDYLDDGMTLGEKTKQFLVNSYGKMRKLQTYMAENKDKNLIVTAATGSGKTEAALLWLDSGKGFFTLPLKVSINNIYQRIHHNTVQYKPCVLLHSDALEVYAEQNDVQTYAVAKQLAAPLTVCTIDQLLKFAYKYNGSELQLATLSYSKLVIDEIQSYSPQLLGTVIYALTLIHQLGGRFAITTATFPKIILPFLEAKNIPIEVSPNFYGDVRHRHCMALKEARDFDSDFMIEQGKLKKVLVIVNTVKRAKQFYEELCQKYDKVHVLHSMFLKRDRQLLEEEIVSFGQSEDIGIWISTQIVEASLDIDFDVLFTEMCSIDSLLQRMGRVFRSREYNQPEIPNVYILANENGVGVKNAVIHREIYDVSLKAVKNVLGDKSCVLLQEHENCDMKQDMINSVYDCLDENSDYYREVKQQINNLERLSWYELAKDDANEFFRDIHSVTVIPRSIFEEKKEELEVLKFQMDHAESLEDRIASRTKLYSYTVDIRYNPRLDREKEPCSYFPGTPVYVCNGTYDFDEVDKSGKGF